MNKLQRIEEMEKQLTALRAEVEQENKVEKWEPKGGIFRVSADISSSRLFGMERETAELARRAGDKMRVFNRLLDYVDEFAPGYEFIYGASNYSVLRKKDGSYEKGVEHHYNACGVVYMPKDVAEELCRKLNSGEVVL